MAICRESYLLGVADCEERIERHLHACQKAPLFNNRALGLGCAINLIRDIEFQFILNHPKKEKTFDDLIKELQKALTRK